MRVNFRSIKDLNVKRQNFKTFRRKYKQMPLGPQIRKGFLQHNIKGVNHRRKHSTMVEF